MLGGEGPRMKKGRQSEPAPTRVALRMDGTWTGNTVLVCSYQLANQGWLAMYYLPSTCIYVLSRH